MSYELFAVPGERVRQKQATLPQHTGEKTCSPRRLLPIDRRRKPSSDGKKRQDRTNCCRPIQRRSILRPRHDPVDPDKREGDAKKKKSLAIRAATAAYNDLVSGLEKESSHLALWTA
ncbi:hypothetical protein BV898_13381 [Hypsibius exemplaris]|uniref:Uncharacterized protein n=1 Tax=Hypsibius exemplaris TaxID=2072580 RepID=A0A1W0WB22_HYPEX|nr:hypothetical protein BV898_13381 [Hypsibius exemplaris]